MSKGRVKCRVCVIEKDGFCSVKKCTTRGNKSRVCGDFVNDFSKVKIKEKVTTVMRPDWYWNQKEMRRAYRELLKNQKEQKQTNDILPETTGTTSPDCLSGFRSTAGVGVTNAPDCLTNLRDNSADIGDEDGQQ